MTCFRKKRGKKNHKQSIGILKGLIIFKENKNSSKKNHLEIGKFRKEKPKIQKI